LPAEPEALVVNTGPLIALGRVDAFDFIHRLPLRFISAAQSGIGRAGAAAGCAAGYRRASSWSSVSASISAQVNLAAAARRTIDPTVDTPSPTLALIARWARSSTSRCLNISRVLRMDNRSVAISPP
jgi:hypothetical protein